MRSASIAAPSPGTDPAFVEAAQRFGKILAENGMRLVYGGGSVGLMGAVASAVLDHGGEVTGIIPEFLTARENGRGRGAGTDRHPRHARAQAADVRARRRLRRAARRHRHAGGTGRAADLGSSSAATRSRSCSPISTASGIRCWRCSTHMRATAIHPRRRCASTILDRRAGRGHPAEAARRRAHAPPDRHRGRWRRRSRDGCNEPIKSVNAVVIAQKRHRLDAVAVGIADEGRVIAARDHAAAGPARHRTCRRPRAPPHGTHRPPLDRARAGRYARRCRRRPAPCGRAD